MDHPDDDHGDYGDRDNDQHITGIQKKVGFEYKNMTLFLLLQLFNILNFGGRRGREGNH